MSPRVQPVHVPVHLAVHVAVRAALLLAVVGQQAGARRLSQLPSAESGGKTPSDAALPDGDLMVGAAGDDGPVAQIVGGVQAAKGRYPYVVNLVRFGFLEFCGGTLVAPNVVLTAAHCDKSSTSVAVGRHDLSDGTEDYESHQVLKKAFPSPGYDPYTNDNDVMLLLLGRKSSRPPVAVDGGDLASASERSDGPGLRAMGWGMTSFQGPTSHVLQEVDVDAIAPAECNKLFQGAVTDNMMCAAGPGRDACGGDSGGPLVRPKDPDDGAPLDVQVGVISWGSGCATYDEGAEGGAGPTGHPGVYVRLARYVPWIQQTLAVWGAEPAKVVTHVHSRLSCAALANYTDRHGEASVCAATKFVGGGACRVAETFPAARAACAAAGARLCTFEEVERHETRGTGCGFDFRRIWSSTFCDGGHVTAQGMKGEDPKCSADLSSAAVRCCADA